MPSYAVILLAAGDSSRFKDREKKPFADLDGRAVWLRSLELFATRDDIEQILIVISRDDEELFERRYKANVAFIPNAKVIFGGKERADSVQQALAHVRPTADFVAVHDAARPCLTAEMLDRVFRTAAERGAAILASPVADTLKRSEDGWSISQTVSRKNLWQAQTPQVFRRSLLLDAYAHRDKLPTPPTDDAELVEALGESVTLVENDSSNIKITTKADLHLAKAILQSRPKPKGSGNLHPFADERMW